MPEQPDAPDQPAEPYEHTHLRPPPPASPPPPPAWAPPPPPAPAPAAPWGQAPPPSYHPGPPSFPQGPPSYGGSYRPTVPLPPGPPSSGRNGLFVGLLVVTAVGLVSVLVLGVLLWTNSRDDDQGDRASDDTSQNDDPGGDGNAAPSAGSATAPSLPTPSETPPPSEEPPPSEPPSGEPPSEEPPPEVDPASPFSYTEYGNDWDFKFGDVALQATFKRGWDYDNCGPVENAGALTDLGCRWASEWTYRALGGDLALTHLVLTMDSAKAAKRAIARDLITSDSWKVQDDSTLPGRDGRWRANAQGEFIVLTVETHEPGVRRAKSDEFLQYANADILGALAFRF